MHEYLKKLHEQRNKLVADMRTALDEAAKRDGGLTAEDNDKIKRFDTDIAELDQRMADVAAAIERTSAENDAVKRALDTQTDPTRGDGFEQKMRDFLDGKIRSISVKPEARDLVKGTASAGGNTVETGFYNQLVEHMIASSGILRSGATILRTDSGEDIQIPTTTAHPTAVLVAEGAALTENDPTFAQRTLKAYKYGVMNQVAHELITDTSVDLLGYLARQCGKAVGNAFGAHAITGTGTAQPTGVVTSASTGVTGGTGVGGAFTADNLIDLYYSVIEEYRDDPSAGWLLRDASVATMRKLKDSAGQYLWNPASEPGKPPTFLDKPVRTDPNVAAVALSAKSVVFGAFSAYFVRQVGEIRFERSDEFAFANDLVTFRCLVRMDGITIDQTGAIKVFTGNAA